MDNKKKLNVMDGAAGCLVSVLSGGVFVIVFSLVFTTWLSHLASVYEKSIDGTVFRP